MFVILDCFQTPLIKVQLHLEEVHGMHYQTLENICSLLDKSDPAIVSSLPKSIKEAQNLRLLIYLTVKLSIYLYTAIWASSFLTIQQDARGILD